MPGKVRVIFSFFMQNLFRVLFLLLLTGCASRSVDQGVQLSDEARHQLWQGHEQQLAALKTWQMSGRLNLKVPKQSGTLSVDWSQQEAQYQIYLDGPFGAAIAAISGDQNQVSVTASEDTMVGSSPEMLLYSMTGWQFPVSYLRRWIKGLPVQGVASKLTLNNQGYPEKIEQAGWVIVYQQYKPSGSLLLPTRLTVSNKVVRLNLLINQWSL
ncbi:lipoprotein insertase outer membrane protein LolB [Endozoicomonas ascidiicola]|uniref:lipoprotein insertase outer membrane protein LolB n=1 Tax=Endozoicomonas ascidiicola TaxID=1698521 RepID=UPI0008371FFE|nr:lipoprotein insertase outer membrane protein LolB [Endozoicomonas ascidiicola]